MVIVINVISFVFRSHLSSRMGASSNVKFAQRNFFCCKINFSYFTAPNIGAVTTTKRLFRSKPEDKVHAKYIDTAEQIANDIGQDKGVAVVCPDTEWSDKLAKALRARGVTVAVVSGDEAYKGDIKTQCMAIGRFQREEVYLFCRLIIFTANMHNTSILK